MSDEHTYRILVVDDEEIVISFVSDALEDDPCEVVTATNGTDALSILHQQSFDLLLTDIRMPGLDGIGLAEKAREMYPDIGVIFMTGYANLNSAKDAIKQGAIDYIMKPFELTEIRQAVRNAMDKKQAVDEQRGDNQLKSLSDLNSMLFRAGDRRSLVISSLKFAMMHQSAIYGAVLFREIGADKYIHVSIDNDITEEQVLAGEQFSAVLEHIDFTSLQRPCLISRLDEHPVYQQRPEPFLEKYLMAPWLSEGVNMVVVPVVRANRFEAIINLGFEQDTARLSETTAQFLAITANQLAITLENLELLEESREAYARLKALQDETIELEKMATRGQMSAEIGHELNNFLGVIAGNMSMLEVKLGNQGCADLNRYVGAVTETIEKIKTFTSNLMDLQPISTDKEVIYFDRLLNEVLEYLTPQKRFRDITIRVEPFDADIPMEADATQLQQVLYNVFNNAADAVNEKGAGSITVSLDICREAGCFSIVIADDGVGFEPELLEKAFEERFTTKATGHGFGLVVCKRIIENHNGQLHVDSERGEGTTISIRFPLSESRQPELV